MKLFCTIILVVFTLMLVVDTNFLNKGPTPTPEHGIGDKCDFLRERIYVRGVYCVKGEPVCTYLISGPQVKTTIVPEYVLEECNE